MLIQIGLQMANKNIALEKIESHEKLCRIMQKQTHDRINQLQNQITRIERILLVSMGSVMTGMAGVIVVLIQKLQRSYIYPIISYIVVVVDLTANDKNLEIRKTEPTSFVKTGHHHVVHSELTFDPYS